MVGILVSFWDGLFSGVMLVLGNECIWNCKEKTSDYPLSVPQCMNLYHQLVSVCHSWTLSESQFISKYFKNTCFIFHSLFPCLSCWRVSASTSPTSTIQPARPWRSFLSDAWNDSVIAPVDATGKGAGSKGESYISEHRGTSWADETVKRAKRGLSSAFRFFGWIGLVGFHLLMLYNP